MFTTPDFYFTADTVCLVNSHQLSAQWWEADGLGQVDHELLYRPKSSRIKCEATSLRAEAWIRLSHNTTMIPNTAPNLQHSSKRKE